MRNLLFSLVLMAIAQIGNAQDMPLQATEEQALIQISVRTMDDVPRVKDVILLEGKQTGKVFRGISNEEGRFSILLPEGDSYLIKIQGLGEETEYSELEIPVTAGKLSGSIVVKYEPARSFRLDDVHFDTGKSTLRSESFASLDDIAELLNIKDNLRVEIAGHTDNVGSDASNLALSQARAEAVVKYLIAKGVPAHRLQAKGYGATQPIADNNSEEGRQLNRRTEARWLEEI